MSNSAKEQEINEEAVHNITSAHDLSGNVDELSAHYSDWAGTYDDDVSSHGYTGPAYIAKLGAKLLKGMADRHPGAAKKDVRILDAGCGTGLVGVELEKLGFPKIYGCDLSQEMVDKAEGTGTYRELHGDINLEEPVTCFGDTRFDAILSCGVFTLGHVPPEALLNLVPLLSEDGVIVLSTRQRYTSEHRFEDWCRKQEQKGTLVLDEVIIGAPYISDEQADYWIVRPPSAAKSAKKVA